MGKQRGWVWKRAPRQSHSSGFRQLGRVFERARWVSPDRMVAVGRIAVVVLVLAEAALDGELWGLRTYFLVACLVASASFACLPGRLLAAAPLANGALLADTGVFAVLIALGGGNFAPNLLLAAFIILAATVRWQWKGALIGAVGLALVIVGAGYVQLFVEQANTSLATVADGNSEPPPTTGALSVADSGRRVGLILTRAAGMLVFGALFAMLAVVAGRLAARGERGRLARNMHDTVLQDIAAANMLLATATSAGVPKIIAEVSELLSEQQRRIRLLLGPPEAASDPHLLIDDLPTLAARLGRQWRCTVSLESGVTAAEVSPAITVELGLMLREAVANAVRHAGASRVHMAVERCDSELRVTFTDDGRSRRSGSMSPPASLAARVASLGGRIATRSGVGGVMVTVELPL